MKPSARAVLGLATLFGLLAGAEPAPARVEPEPSNDPHRCPKCGGAIRVGGRASYCTKQRCGWFEVRQA